MDDSKPRVEWVRDDIAAATGSMLRSMKAHADAHAHDKREERGRDTVYLMIDFAGGGLLKATAVSGLPEGHVLEVLGVDREECVFEARHQLIAIYGLCKLPGDTSREVRERALNTSIELISETR